MARPSTECGTIRARLAADPDVRTEPFITAHLATCEECAQWAAGVERLAAAAGKLRIEPNPRDADVALLLARKARAQVLARPRFPRWGWPALSASLSTAAAILVIGLSPSRGSQTANQPTAGARDPVATGRTPGTKVAQRQGDISLATWVLLPRDRSQDTLPKDLQRLRQRAVLQRRSRQRGSGSTTGVRHE